MPRTPAYLVLASVTGTLLTACGGSASSGGAVSGAAPVTGATSAPAASGSPTPGFVRRSGGQTSLPTATTSAGGATTAPSSAAGSSSNSNAGSSATQSDGGVPLPPPGSYKYQVSGRSTSALGSQSLDGESTLTVDHPKGGREHTSQQDKGGSTEQVLVSRAGGLFLADIHLSQPGFDEDFRPSNPVLLFPKKAQPGRQWHWQMTSTDGKYTLTARLTLTDLHSSATMTDGTRVSTVSLSSVLHVHSNDIDLTIHQRDEASRDAVIVRERAITDGTAYGTKFHSDATRVLSSRPH